ncbi:hypothetical protein VULLAG_LOCUS22786 [Vulpes lagopus]
MSSSQRKPSGTVTGGCSRNHWQGALFAWSFFSSESQLGQERPLETLFSLAKSLAQRMGGRTGRKKRKKKRGEETNNVFDEVPRVSSRVHAD